ncbi:hypothetical protein T11_16029 [Trichinella zimbabwensis]|uniref:Uncharacterized protein n=1 Tax=Trichinella zimbabwensis TaxID=268475 RepID=A0A0V1GTM1_9BILA|nr:hypothetical protein T11_16029 [Trichinella zimbabwensis]
MELIPVKEGAQSLMARMMKRKADQNSGSERSLISTNVEDELELPGLMNAMTVKGLNGLYVRIANFHRVLFCLTSV